MYHLLGYKLWLTSESYEIQPSWPSANPSTLCHPEDCQLPTSHLPAFFSTIEPVAATIINNSLLCLPLTPPVRLFPDSQNTPSQ